MANIQFAEAWLNRFYNASKPHFEAQGLYLPENLRIRIGLPIEGYRSKALANYIPPEMVADGYHEIYVSPKVAEGDARIADLVTHELCHAAVGAEHKHDKTFAAAAYAMGLKDKPTATTAGDAWFDWALPILDDLGPMDFAALSADLKPTKVKKTYLHKLECPDCGWLAQVTKSHVEPHAYLNCPVPDCGGTLVYYRPEDEPAE